MPVPASLSHSSATRLNGSLVVAGAIAATALFSRRGRGILTAGLLAAAGYQIVFGKKKPVPASRVRRSPVAAPAPEDVATVPAPAPEMEPVPVIAVAQVTSPTTSSDESDVTPLPLVWEAGASGVSSSGAAAADTVWYGLHDTTPLVLSFDGTTAVAAPVAEAPSFSAPREQVCAVSEMASVTVETAAVQEAVNGMSTAPALEFHPKNDQGHHLEPLPAVSTFPSPKSAAGIVATHSGTEIERRLPQPRKSGEAPRMLAADLPPPPPFFASRQAAVCGETPSVAELKSAAIHRSALPQAPSAPPSGRKTPVIVCGVILIFLVVAFLIGMVMDVPWLNGLRHDWQAARGHAMDARPKTMTPRVARFSAD